MKRKRKKNGSTTAILVEPEKLLQNRDNLIIYEKSNSDKDITEIGWSKEFTPNEYINDLNHPPQTFQREGRIVKKALEDGRELLDFQFTFIAYITPSRMTNSNYELYARLITQDGNDPGPVMLNTEVFFIDANCLEVRSIKKVKLPDEYNSYYYWLHVLAYNSLNTNFGEATLNNINQKDDYLGIVMDENKNICMLYVDPLYNQHYTGVMYYPALIRGIADYPLNTAEPTEKLIDDLELFNVETSEATSLSRPSIFIYDDAWNSPGGITQDDLNRAHSAGIPLVSVYAMLRLHTGSHDSLNQLPTGLPTGFELKRGLEVYDNCGNAMLVYSTWENKDDEGKFEITNVTAL